MNSILSYPIQALVGGKRKADWPAAVVESNISLSPEDSGFHPLVHAGFKASLYGPEHVLKSTRTPPQGMTVDEKENAQVSYPPDKIIQDMWKNNRKEYERLKTEMFAHPKVWEAEERQRDCHFIISD